MRRTLLIALAAVGMLAVGTRPGRAEVYIRVPFFTLVVGPRACPGPPLVHVAVGGLVDVQVRPRPRVVVAESSIRDEGMPIREAVPPRHDRVQPPPPEPYPTSVRPRTLAEFAGSFKPASGSYETVLIHPVSMAPVKVRFTLPEGSPRKVRVARRELVFDYGRHKVKLRFVHDGRVKVVSR